MKYFWIAPVIALALASMPIAAQTEPGKFPEHRIRIDRNNPVHVPDEVYVGNRVILRSLELLPSGTGMQFSGEIITDFDADIVPSEEDDILRGQQPVSIDIELVHFHTQIRRRGGAAQDPNINATNPAARRQQVPGQFVTVTASERVGSFGFARFALPPLTKPLAPGVYAVQARVTFAAQPGTISRAIRYCSDWYGSEYKVDPVTFEESFEPVLNDPQKHDEIYQRIRNTIGSVSSVATVFIGNIAPQGVVQLVPTGRDDEVANHVLWVPHIEVASLVEQYEYQLANADQVIDEQLEAKKRVDGAKPEDIERWEKEAEDEKKMIRTNNTHLIALMGGETSEEERAMVRVAKAARPALIEQIALFEEELSKNYWILSDGHLHYGWHRVNAPGVNVFRAIESQNVRAAAGERKARLERLRENRNEELNKLWEEREQTFRHQPKEIKDIAFAYLKDRDETDKFDAENFCEEVGGKVELDVAAWAEYRATFRNDFLEKTEALLQQVTTTNRYANQVWPEALQQARGARDSVISLTYSFEFFIRTTQLEHDAEIIAQGWRDEDAQHPTLRLSDFFSASRSAPAAIRTRYDGHWRELRRAAAVEEFARQYKAASEAANITGRRPNSDD